MTGAASGIGRATAELLARRGAALALGDLDVVAQDELAERLRGQGCRAAAFALDVTERESIERFRERVLAIHGGVDLIVNGAGVAAVGGLLATGDEDWDWVMNVNLRGPALVCRAFLPAMIARARGGQLVNVASAAAFYSPPELVAYGASKHGLVGLSEGLREELREHGIGVSVVCPGFVATPIVERARFVAARDPEAERAKARAFLSGRGLSPESVAFAIVRAAERGQGVTPVGAVAWSLYLLGRFAPSAPAAAFRLVKRRLRA